MSWTIVTDSSCDLLELTNAPIDVRYASVPFTIRIDNVDYIDDENLCVADMLAAMEKSPEASHTSCPSPGSWYNEFIKADNIIAITISGQLSGSYNAAMVAQEMVKEEYPQKNIFVLDSRSTGPELVMIVERIEDLIRKHHSFKEVATLAQNFANKTSVLFTLLSFENLVKNGRMSRMAGFIAGKFSMRAIGVASTEGKIVMKHKFQGDKRALHLLVEDMIAMGFAGSPVTISHCENYDLATGLKEKLMEMWNSIEVKIFATRGLCSYYVERGGLILAF